MLRNFESTGHFPDPLGLRERDAIPEVKGGVLTSMTRLYTEAICDWCGAKEILDRDDKAVEQFEPFVALRNWVGLRVEYKNGATNPFHFCCRKCRADYAERDGQHRAQREPLGRIRATTFTYG